VFVVEGQVARFKDNITIAWGKQAGNQAEPGVCLHRRGPARLAGGSTGTLLVSSLAALQEIIRLVGFQSLELVHPNSPLHEQYVNFYRAIVFAFV
jgi:hypothetical protein